MDRIEEMLVDELRSLNSKIDALRAEVSSMTARLMVLEVKQAGVADLEVRVRDLEKVAAKATMLGAVAGIAASLLMKFI